MKYLLDTNTLSLAMKGDREVCARLLTHSRPDVLLPQPVIAEIRYGLSRMKKSKRLDALTQRFDLFLNRAMRAEWTDEVSRAFGILKVDLERKGSRIEDFDVAIAAHAIVLDGTLVSTNEKHMARIPGLRLENWRP